MNAPLLNDVQRLQLIEVIKATGIAEGYLLALRHQYHDAHVTNLAGLDMTIQGLQRSYDTLKAMVTA
jgi:hypothetical protein